MGHEKPISLLKLTNPVSWVVLVVLILGLGVGVFYLVSQDNKVEMIGNVNSQIGTRLGVTNDPEKGRNVFRSSNPNFSFTILDTWHHFIEQNSSPKIILTASNENTESILALTNQATGLILHVSLEDFYGSVAEFFINNPALPADISEERIAKDEILINGITFARRRIDSTNIPDWEGSYSSEYIAKIGSSVVRFLFLALTEQALVNSQSEITEIMSSFKAW